jgi:hypothetical protein
LTWMQLRVADLDVGVGFQLRHEDDRGLVRARHCMPVHAVIRRVQPAADKPLPEWRVAGVQGCLPRGIPGQQVRVLLETAGEFVLGETLGDGRVLGVGLLDERRRRADSTPPHASAPRSAPRRPAPQNPATSGFLPLSCLSCLSPEMTIGERSSGLPNTPAVDRDLGCGCQRRVNLDPADSTGQRNASVSREDSR